MSAADEIINLCRLSVNHFVEYVVKLQQAPLHRRIQQMLSAKTNCMIRLPRGHGKSVQAAARVAWMIGRNEDVRIKYIQQNDKEPPKSVRFIKSIIESEEYGQIFPNIRPDRELWGSTALCVKRRRFMRDPTLEACSIFGRAGGRADVLIADDVCDLRNTIQQSALRPQVIEAWTNTWEPMLDEASPAVKRIWKFGTPYHVADIVAKWEVEHRVDDSLLNEPVVGYKSPWGEVWTEELLRRRELSMGPIAFSRAYRLVPVSGTEIIFKPEWIDHALYLEAPDFAHTGNSRRVLTIDWAYTEESLKNPDPDWSIAMLGIVDWTGHVWVENMERVRMAYPDFKKLVLARSMEWSVDEIHAEPGGAQGGLVDDLNRSSRVPVIRAAREKKLDKVSRASAQAGFVSSGRFHVRGCDNRRGGLQPIPVLQALYDEMTTFPVADHDDTVDAAVDMMAVAGRSPPRHDDDKPRSLRVPSRWAHFTGR